MTSFKLKAVILGIALTSAILSGSGSRQEPAGQDQLNPSTQVGQDQLNLLTQGTIETREYIAENGRKIKIASTGNLVGLESPEGFEHIGCKRQREGYVLTYTDLGTGITRVLHDVFDRYSTSIQPGQRDFVPVSFSGPLSGTAFQVNTVVSATAVVDTRDGLFRLTHQFSWKSGTGAVSVSTTVTNRTNRALYLRAYKRHVDIDLDGCGPYGSSQNLNNVVTDSPASQTLLIFNKRCMPPSPSPCPPCPPFIDNFVASQHLCKITGSSAPTHLVVKPATDDSELVLLYPGASFSGRKEREDDQETIAWRLNVTLNAGASRSFTIIYEVN